MGDAAGGRAGELPPEQSALDQRALRTLQLAARNHTLLQIAVLRAVDVLEVLEDLQRAVSVLGTESARQAIDEARRRGLLD